MDRPDSTVILGSGSGLGTYVPALFVRDLLRARGRAAEVAVFEELLPTAQQEVLDRTRAAYHERFELALAGQKLAFSGALKPTADDGRADELIESWSRRGVRRFFSVSGYWLPILDRHARSPGAGPLDVRLCCLDAADSPSWMRLGPRPGFQFFRLASRDTGTLDWQIPIRSTAPPVAFEERPRRVVAHGGGWGLGRYRDGVAALIARGWQVDVDVFHEEEAGEERPGVRRFATDPRWRPWHRDEAGEHAYPPLLRIREGRATACPAEPGAHAMFGLVREARAVVSKPGGGTLIESLAAATPVILLDPFGPNEAANAGVWLRLGFGLRWEQWAETGFDAEALAPLHRALIAARSRVPWLPL